MCRMTPHSYFVHSWPSSTLSNMITSVSGNNITTSTNSLNETIPYSFSDPDSNENLSYFEDDSAELQICITKHQLHPESYLILGLVIVVE